MKKFYSLLLLGGLLLFGVNNAWAYWYAPGTMSTWNADDGSKMNGSNVITYYAVPAGQYYFKLAVDKDGGGQNWGFGNLTNGSSSIITELTTGTGSGNNSFTTNATSDITFTITDEGNWKCTVTASDPTYHLKYNWNGTGWSWKTLENNGDGTYSCAGEYSGSNSGAVFNFKKRTSNNDSWCSTGEEDDVTLVNTPSSAGDDCVFTYDPSTDKLEIRKCNSVTKKNYFYFDNTNAGWNDAYFYFVIGRPGYSKVYPLENIAGTSWYYGLNSSDDWSDAGYYAIIGSGEEWSEGYYGQGNIKNANHYSAAYVTPLDFAAEDVVVIRKADAANDGAITITKNEFVHKTITTAGWATYCSSHALDFSSSIANLTAAYIVIGGTNGVLAKTQVTGTVPANTGLLLKGEGVCFIPTVASSETDVSSNILTGVTESTGIAAAEGWVLMSDGSHGLGFYQNANAFTVGANTAYIPVSKLPVPAGAPARFLLEDEVNGATDIQNIEANDKAVKFIENGRILIKKNGVVYDALGCIVK